MLQFGQYKGKDLSDVADFDYQYVTWVANNIPNLNKRLDSKDYHFINMLIHPADYLHSTYKDFDTLSDEEALAILKKEGLVKTAYQYLGNDGALHYTIETLYGCRYGSSSVMPPFVTADGISLSKEALELITDYAKNHFPVFYKKAV